MPAVGRLWPSDDDGDSDHKDDDDEDKEANPCQPDWVFQKLQKASD